jgi:hypothetical protein
VVLDAGNSGTPNPSSAITVSAWLYPTAYQFAIPVGRDNITHNDSVYAFKWRDSGNQPFWRVRDNSSNNHDVTLSSIPSFNQWFHTAMTYDGTTMKVYLNGALNGSTQFSGTIEQSTQSLRLGQGIGNEYFPGKIDDVRIYNRALSATEVKQLYNAGR